MSGDPLAELAAIPARDDWRHKGCPFSRLLATLDPERAETLRRLVDETQHSGPRISKAAAEAGIDLPARVIQVHRSRTQSCKCPPK